MAGKKASRKKSITKTGRPGKYETNVKPRLDEIRARCRDGCTDEELAKALGIAVSTLNEYKRKFPEFSEALKCGKDAADYRVENALFKKALGYNAKVRKNIKVKIVEYDETTGKKTAEREEIREVEDEIHVPADTTAQIYWLSNRKRGVWVRQPEKEVEKDVEISVSFDDDSGEGYGG